MQRVMSNNGKQRNNDGLTTNANCGGGRTTIGGGGGMDNSVNAQANGKARRTSNEVS